jgi:radical SAM-linked protein
MSLMRAKFTREAPVQWMLYREYLHAIQQAVEAADLPVASAGTPPRPVLQSGLPLAPGHLSRCEYVDFVVCSPLTAADFGRRLSHALPAGIRLVWQRRMPSRTPSLKAAIRGFRYTMSGAFDPARGTAFEAAPTWPLVQIRKGRERVLDLKQSVPRLRVEPNRVIFDIEVREEGMPKPEEVFASVFGVTLQEALSVPTERTAVRLAPAIPPHRSVLE